MSEMSEQVRKGFKAADDIRDAGLTTPEDIVRYDDILYGEDAAWQKLDVYRPKEAEGELLPVIVSVHGGGWVYGDKERYQYYCMNLAQRGFAVVNFTYRLAPEYKYPSNIEDTNSVFCWVLSHAEEYGFDTKHIFAVGDSAGAHNLGLYCAICTNPEYAAKYEFQPPKGFVPTAVALNCGVYEIEVNEAGEAGNPLMADYLPGKGTPEEIERLSVLRHITSDYPPTFCMTAVGDFLKTHAALLHEKLTECDVPHVLRLYGTKENRLPHVFHCDMRSADAKLCNDEECEFFRKFCCGLQ